MQTASAADYPLQHFYSYAIVPLPQGKGPSVTCVCLYARRGQTHSLSFGTPLAVLLHLELLKETTTLWFIPAFSLWHASGVCKDITRIYVMRAIGSAKWPTYTPHIHFALFVLFALFGIHCLILHKLCLFALYVIYVMRAIGSAKWPIYTPHIHLALFALFAPLAAYCLILHIFCFFLHYMLYYICDFIYVEGIVCMIPTSSQFMFAQTDIFFRRF